MLAKGILSPPRSWLGCRSGGGSTLFSPWGACKVGLGDWARSRLYFLIFLENSLGIYLAKGQGSSGVIFLLPTSGKSTFGCPTQ